jgi:hypothetical protein
MALLFSPTRNAMDEEADGRTDGKSVSTSCPKKKSDIILIFPIS